MDETQKFHAVEEDKSRLFVESLSKVKTREYTQNQWFSFESTREPYDQSSESQITKDTTGVDADGVLIFMSGDDLDEY